MTRMNLLLVSSASSWSRLMAKARKDRRNRGPLWEAYEAMRLEQRAEGERAGIVMCDTPWCSCPATHSWERITVEMKRMTRKVKGQRIEPLPIAYRCSAHLPAFAPEWMARYQPIAVYSLPVAA